MAVPESWTLRTGSFLPSNSFLCFRVETDQSLPQAFWVLLVPQVSMGKAQAGPSQAYIRQADWSSFHGGFLECPPIGSCEVRLCEEPQNMGEQFGESGTF